MVDLPVTFSYPPLSVPLTRINLIRRGLFRSPIQVPENSSRGKKVPREVRS